MIKSAQRPLRTLRRDQHGVTIVEFAMVLPVLSLMLLGFFDLGYRAYVGAVLQGALHEAARMATVGSVPMEQVDAHVRSRLQSFSRGATVAINASSYLDYSDVKQPEKIVQDTFPFGVYNPGDCFEDANGNGQYDHDRGKSGLGNADDVVRYEVSITFPRLFPLAGFLGWEKSETITSSTMLRNQPFAARSTGIPVIC